MLIVLAQSTRCNATTYYSGSHPFNSREGRIAEVSSPSNVLQYSVKDDSVCDLERQRALRGEILVRYGR